MHQLSAKDKRFRNEITPTNTTLKGSGRDTYIKKTGTGPAFEEKQNVYFEKRRFNANEARMPMPSKPLVAPPSGT